LKRFDLILAGRSTEGTPPACPYCKADFQSALKRFDLILAGRFTEGTPPACPYGISNLSNLIQSDSSLN